MSGASMAEVHRALEALVGQRGPAVAGVVTRRDVERFAVASGETSPIYTDEAAARDAGYARIPCPPLLLSSVIEWGAGPPLAALREDGTGVGRESWLPLDGLRLMGGGQDLVLHATVLSDTEFTAQPMLESVELKEGGSGPLVLMVIATDFRGRAGEELVTCRETLIAR